MPATNPATVPRSVSTADLLAEITQQSTEAAHVPTLVALGRAMESLGTIADLHFARDEAGRITGVSVSPIEDRPRGYRGDDDRDDDERPERPLCATVDMPFTPRSIMKILREGTLA